MSEPTYAPHISNFIKVLEGERQREMVAFIED